MIIFILFFISDVQKSLFFILFFRFRKAQIGEIRGCPEFCGHSEIRKKQAIGKIRDVPRNAGTSGMRKQRHIGRIRGCPAMQDFHVIPERKKGTVEQKLASHIKAEYGT